jgi:hypothetical protein
LVILTSRDLTRKVVVKLVFERLFEALRTCIRAVADLGAFHQAGLHIGMQLQAQLPSGCKLRKLPIAHHEQDSERQYGGEVPQAQ